MASERPLFGGGLSPRVKQPAQYWSGQGKPDSYIYTNVLLLLICFMCLSSEMEVEVKEEGLAYGGII